MTQARASKWEKEVGKLDTEDVISAVQKEPAIWNSSLEEYTDKIAKRNAWSNVITAFFADFANQSQEDKRVLGSIFQRRWKSLRDGYSRENLKRKAEQKSGAAASGRKSYVYYEQLRFLETLAKPTKDSMEEEELQDADEPGTQGPEEIARPAKKGKMGNKRDSDDDILMKTLKAQLLQKSVDANNEDRLFMLSLVPELKKVPECMKLEARTRLLAVFSQIRLEVQRVNSAQTPYQQQNPNYPAGYGNYGGNFQGPNARQWPIGQHDPPLLQIAQQPRQRTVPVPATAYQTPTTPTGNHFVDLSPSDSVNSPGAASSVSSEVDFGSF